MEDVTNANGEAVLAKAQKVENKPVVVVPLDQAQIQQLQDYNKYKDTHSEHRYPPPKPTEEQLSSIPDRLEGRVLTQEDKTQLLYKKSLGDIEKGEPSFHIDENNNINRFSITGTETNAVHSEIVLKQNDVTFNNKFPELINNTLKNEVQFEQKEENELIQKAPELKTTTEALMNNDNRLSNNEINYVEKLHAEINKTNEPIKIIPLTQEQIQNRANSYNEEQKTLPDYKLTQEQMDSIPDKINGVVISDEQKQALYNNDFPNGGIQIEVNNGKNSIFLEIDWNNNNILRSNDGDNLNLPEGPVLKNEVEYNVQRNLSSITNNTSSIDRLDQTDNNLFEKPHSIENTPNIASPDLQNDPQPVKIIGLTPEQQDDLSKHIERQTFLDLPIHRFPELTKEQLNSIPDVIDGIEMNETYKARLLTGTGLDDGLVIQGLGTTYHIDENSNIIRAKLVANENNPEDIWHETTKVLNTDVQFKNIKNVSLDNTGDQTYIAPKNDDAPITVIPLSNDQKQTFNDINDTFSVQTNKPNANPNDAITVIPLTSLQKETFQSINKNFDITDNPNKSQQFFSDNTLNHQEAINAFAKTIAPNLASVPDHMDGQKLTQDDKLKLLTGSLSLTIDGEGNTNTYTLNEKNQIVRTQQLGEQQGLQSIVTIKDTIAPDNTRKSAVLNESSLADPTNPASISTKTVKTDSIKDLLVVPNISIVTGNNIGQSFVNSFSASFAKKPGGEHTVTTENNGKTINTGEQIEKILSKNPIISPTNENEVIKIVQISSTNMAENNKNLWKPTDVKWSSLEKIGVTQKSLAESGDLDKLLSGQRTSMIQIKGSIGDVKVESSAKLRLVADADGNPKLMIHGPSKQLEIKDELFGHKFSQKEKDELKENGRLKEPIKLTDPKTKKTGDFYVGVDLELNKVVVIAKEAILNTKSLDQLNGVKLTPIQQDKILSGTDIKLDNKPGSPTIIGKIDFSNNSFKITGTSSHAEKQSVDNSAKQEKAETQEIKQPKEKTGFKIKV